MHEYLPFVIAGITTGAVYAMAASGLVLTYSTSGVFNLAHGAVGMLCAYLFYSLRVDLGVPTWLAFAMTILVVAPGIGLLIDRVLFSRLRTAEPVSYVVVSLGLLVALQGLVVAVYGGETRVVAPIFPTRTYRLPGINVGVDQTIVVALAVAAWVGLGWFMNRTKVGLQTRAVVDDIDLTELSAVNSRRITTLSWALGTSFAAMSGILFIPLIGLDSLVLTLLVVQAFGAAVLGRLTDLNRTNLAAFGLGIVGGIVTKLTVGRPGLAGLSSSLPFIALFLMLVLSRKGTFVELLSTRSEQRTSGRSSRPHRWPVRILVPGVAVASILPSILSGSQMVTATATIAFILLFSSLSLLVGRSGQVSLCHAVFVVFGATTLSHFLGAGIPFLLALPLAAIVLVPVGALVAIPAVRLSGLFLALATFGFGVLAQNLLFGTSLAFGRAASVTISRPSFLEGDTAFYFYVLVTVVIGVVAIEAARFSRVGRILGALADSERGVESLGIGPTTSRVIVFAFSAFWAAVAGGLLGSLVQRVNPVSFDAFQSLIWLTVLVLCGAQTLGGSVMAALLLVAAPSVLTAPEFVKWQPVVFGIGAIVLAQSRNGFVGLLRGPAFASLAERSAWRRGSRRRTERRAATDPTVLAGGAPR